MMEMNQGKEISAEAESKPESRKGEGRGERREMGVDERREMGHYGR